MLLLAPLTVLVAYVLAPRADVLGTITGGGADTAADCPIHNAPNVESVSRATLLGLRENLRGVMFGRARRLYELGLVSAITAWSDSEPGRDPSLPSSASSPGGYELRWWASNGDDVVADGFIFRGAARARDFFDRATSSRCRAWGATIAAPSPPGARDLFWRNPDDFFQEDVYLLRDIRVYRVRCRACGGKRNHLSR